MPVKIKVCGFTVAEEAAEAASAGIDYAGVIFAQSSPRFVDPARAKAIASAVRAAPNSSAKIVGVFTEGSFAEISRAAQTVELDVIQLHFGASEELVQKLKSVAEVWRVFWLSDEADVRAALASNADAVLLDSRSGGKVGGTGVSANWALAAEVAARRRAVLAGGISPQNAAAAVSAVSPWGLDANSGVEISAGRKDISKIRELLSFKL